MPPDLTPPPVPPDALVFCLGGADLEMETIAALVRDTLGAAHVIDHRPPWGATADLYAADIARILAAGRVPVLVELPPGRHPLPAGCRVVDHHGPLAGATAPTALEQVFALLRLPPERWSRHFALVAANDRGHVAAMRALGATRAEMAAIRAADRRAQGITPAEETSAEAALSRAEHRLGGRLLVVHLPHARTAPLTDRLALAEDGPAEPESLVVVSPGEVNVYGPGRVVAELDAAFPGGWSGGALPQRGFWGLTPAPPEAAVLAVVKAAMMGEPLGRT